MFFSLLTLSLAFAGYTLGNPWMIVAGIVVGIIAIRRTVFSFNRLGTLVNFIVIIVAVTLGILSIPDNESDRQVVAKVEPQRIFDKPPVVKTVPAPKTNQYGRPLTKPVQQGLSVSSTEVPEPYTGEPNREHMAQLDCSYNNEFDSLTFGENRIYSLYIKFCPNIINSIKIYYEPQLIERREEVVWVGDKPYSHSQAGINVNVNDKGRYNFLTVKPSQELFTTGVGKGSDYVIYHLMIEDAQANRLMKEAMAMTPTKNKQPLEGVPMSESDIESMACVTQDHLDQMILSRKSTEQLFKLCDGRAEIKYSEVVYERIAWNVWVKDHEEFTQTYNDEFALITTKSAPGETNSGVVHIETQQNALLKNYIQFLIIDLKVNMESRL